MSKEQTEFDREKWGVEEGKMGEKSIPGRGTDERKGAKT